ncbi:hypothetical protein TSUD_67310 [Trifolium subterraneum]|uniref:Peptidase C1A papain C-terminal domain-containing protein n=1 Tax=Trifolium subterraneum TaxID=3900 RepID=A0A2Z6MTJ2_TRISU|nr:hypothetical protein TSUD_67310 [Trifolium subterraneum]
MIFGATFRPRVVGLRRRRLWKITAFQYIQLFGIGLADDYSLVYWKQLYSLIPGAPRYRIDEFVQIPFTSYDKYNLQKAARQPVAVTIYGIYKGEPPKYYIAHAVLVIGYGTLNGEDYLLIKNSYGPNWGI